MHYLIDFKGFADIKLNLFQGVTVLIGKNGSGKTNVIEGVELFGQLAQGCPLYEVTDLGKGGGRFEIRGGLSSCVRMGKDKFTLVFGESILYQGRSENFDYHIQIQTRSDGDRISKEYLKLGNRTIFQATLENPSSDLLHGTYDNFAKGRNRKLTLSSDRSLLSRYESFTNEVSYKKPYQQTLQVVNALRNYLKASFVFDPQPKTMRDYERIGQRSLLRDGSNLSSVLYSLSQSDKKKDQQALASILRRIQHVPEEPFEDFDFTTTARNDVLLGMKFKSQVIDARLLSDGSLRALAVFTALETVSSGSRIVIEEFDNGVHPSRVKELTDAIWDCQQRRKLNVLVTTHNPAVLNTLSRKQLEGVMLCYWDERERASQLLYLLDLSKADVFLERGDLGDLVTRDVIATHLFPDFEEQQKDSAKRWLEAL